MKLVPLYKVLAGLEKWDPLVLLLDQFPARSMVVVLPAGTVFPAGTLKYDAETGITVFRETCSHYHCMPNGMFVDNGIKYPELAICVAARLGTARRRLRRFLARYTPIDQNVQAYRLRNLVREGD